MRLKKVSNIICFIHQFITPCSYKLSIHRERKIERLSWWTNHFSNICFRLKYQKKYVLFLSSNSHPIHKNLTISKKKEPRSSFEAISKFLYSTKIELQQISAGMYEILAIILLAAYLTNLIEFSTHFVNQYWIDKMICM